MIDYPRLKKQCFKEVMVLAVSLKGGGGARTFAPVVNKSLLNLGKQVLQSGVQVLDDVSREEDVKVAIKRRAVEGAKRMGNKSINRAPTRKTVSRKRTVT